VHVVASGDTVWGIARRYGTTVDAIVRVNRLQSAAKIYPGDRLRVPEFPPPRGRTTASRSVRAGPVAKGRGGPRAPLLWPVKGRLSSGYGRRWGSHHDGIDIAAERGTPILAAADGVVVHSDNALAGYGNLIIVKHGTRRATVYAHNRVNRVKVGQRVRRGQVIGEVGTTGRTTGPHLHFEVREDGRATDPLEFLP